MREDYYDWKTAMGGGLGAFGRLIPYGRRAFVREELEYAGGVDTVLSWWMDYAIVLIIHSFLYN